MKLNKVELKKPLLSIPEEFELVQMKQTSHKTSSCASIVFQILRELGNICKHGLE